MVVISYSGKEANGKIVYYGPGLGGKTTNLEFIYDSVPASSRGKMVSMKTQTDRTLFFDFLPLDLGELGGFKTRLLLYTVPGQVFYNATRKLVLRGADAIAFVADSQRGKMEENKESLANLEENLADYDMSLDSIPWVIQYNKRDLPDIYTVEELNRELNPKNVPFFEAVATEGIGVFETFRGLSKLLLEKLSEEIGQRMVIGRHFGQKKEEEGAGTSEGTAAYTTEDESLVASESALGEVEPIEDQRTEEDAPTAEAPARIAEEERSKDLSPTQAERTSDLIVQEVPPEKHAEETTGPTEPTIVHEQEKVDSFFADDAQSPPLEAEIQREEVLLSQASDSQAETDEPQEESPTETEERSQEPRVERTIEQEKQEEAQDEEASFLGIIRRNNVGVFKTEDTSKQARPEASTEQDASAEQGLQHVIEVPVQMAPDEEEREIVLTVRLRLTRRSGEKEKQSSEFLLDGISR